MKSLYIFIYIKYLFIILTIFIYSLLQTLILLHNIPSLVNLILCNLKSLNVVYIIIKYYPTK